MMLSFRAFRECTRPKVQTEAGSLTTRRREKFDLRELVGELAQKWRPTLPAPDRLNLSLPEHPLPVAADRQMVKTALSYLIDNAVKYSPPATAPPSRIAPTATGIPLGSR